MKKTIKKAVKKVVKAKKEKVLSTVAVNLCPSCKGVGLARPDWVGSEKCGACNGNGTV